MELSPFHLAIPVSDLQKARQFYVDHFRCRVGRESDHWVDLDFYGHQLVLHVSQQQQNQDFNPVDGKSVPVPHFGVVLLWKQWHELVDHLTALEVKFEVEPYIRFKGEIGEQATCFFFDPSGNALEFKAFRQPDQLFAH